MIQKTNEMVTDDLGEMVTQDVGEMVASLLHVR